MYLFFSVKKKKDNHLSVGYFISLNQMLPMSLLLYNNADIVHDDNNNG